MNEAQRRLNTAFEMGARDGLTNALALIATIRPPAEATAAIRHAYQDAVRQCSEAVYKELSIRCKEATQI